jgi:hypothetical protein
MSLSDVEIAALRSEIVQHSSQLLDVTKVAITAATAIMGFGLTRPTPESALIVLLPLLILWPSFVIVRNRRMNVMRIATYLRAFGGESFQYETRLRSLRKSDALIRWPSFYRATAGTFLLLGYISLVLSVLLLILGKNFYYLIVWGVAAVVWTSLAWKVRRDEVNVLLGGKAEDAMFEAWVRS